MCVQQNNTPFSPCSSDWKHCRLTIHHISHQPLCFTSLKRSKPVQVVMWRLLIQPYVEACFCSALAVMKFVGHTWFRWSFMGLVISRPAATEDIWVSYNCLKNSVMWLSETTYCNSKILATVDSSEVKGLSTEWKRAVCKKTILTLRNIVTKKVKKCVVFFT